MFSLVVIAAPISLICGASFAQHPNGNVELTQLLFGGNAVYDFGAVCKGPRARHVFKITNRSKVQIMFGEIRSSSNAMKVSMATRKINPNETCELEVVVDTRRLNVGKKSMNLFLQVLDGSGSKIGSVAPVVVIEGKYQE